MKIRALREPELQCGTHSPIESGAMKPGRNEPCPCGSGKKYKRCHAETELREVRTANDSRHAEEHDLDLRWVPRIVKMLEVRFESELLAVVNTLNTYPEISAQLAFPWLAYVATYDGRRAVEWFLDHEGSSLSPRVRNWLELQRATYLSIWEVVEVDPGRSLTLRDALTEQTRTVREVKGAQLEAKHRFLLARIADAQPDSLICGSHERTLAPIRGAKVIEAMRKYFRRKGAIEPERLMEEKAAWRLLQEWSNAIMEENAPPRLVNTEGDPILLTSDRWTFDRGRREEVVARIRAWDDAELDGDRFAILRESDFTVVAHLGVEGSTLISETNSIARADAMRDRIERAMGELLSKSMRSHSDLQSTPNQQMASGARLPAPTQDEEAMIRAYKEQHYARWIDEAIPALQGKTPREAARSKSLREKLIWMLNDLELKEQSQPEGTRYSVEKLRDVLGLSKGSK